MQLLLALLAAVPAAGLVPIGAPPRRTSALAGFDPRISPHAYGSKTKVGVIIVDHGSRREESNKRHESLCRAYASTRARPNWIVRPAHMELAQPSIADAFDDCVREGCELVVCHPLFLGPGRHVVEDVPALLEEANARHPNVRSLMTEPLGNSPLLVDLIHDMVVPAVERKETEPDAFKNSFFGQIQAAIDAQAAAPKANAEADK